MISDAMCTFSGSSYIDDQLASILSQTRTPDELVICDDQSTDATLSMLERFAKSPWALLAVICLALAVYSCLSLLFCLDRREKSSIYEHARGLVRIRAR